MQKELNSSRALSRSQRAIWRLHSRHKTGPAVDWFPLYPSGRVREQVSRQISLAVQARQWCDRVNATYKKYIRAVPRELFAVERLHLKPLPAWIPEVYRLHQRTVDVEGYVSVNSIRYSVPVSWI